MSNTFAITEVLDYNVFAYSASGYGDVLFSVDYASSSNIGTTAERLSIRGGQGNFKILDLDHTKDCTFNSMLPLVDVNALAVKLGKTVSIGAKTVNKKEILIANASSEVTLGATPVTGSLRVYKLEHERDLGTEQTVGSTPNPNEYTISGAILTFNSSSVGENSKVVVFYDYTSGVNAKNIKITAADFPNFITITGRGLLDDDQEGKKVPVAFKVHKAKVQPSFELSMAGTEATELDFTVDCYTIINAEGEREYIDMTILSDEAI